MESYFELIYIYIEKRTGSRTINNDLLRIKQIKTNSKFFSLSYSIQI